MFTEYQAWKFLAKEFRKAYDDKIIISYDGHPLVIIENIGLKLPSDILAWYAEVYAFDLSKLTWTHIPTVRMP